MIYFKLNKLKIKLCGLSNCISLEEANKQPLKAYVITEANGKKIMDSGVRVGPLDLKYETEQTLNKYGLNSTLIERLKQYFGLSGKKAEEQLQDKPFELTQSEFDIITKKVKDFYLPKVAMLPGRFRKDKRVYSRCYYEFIFNALFFIFYYIHKGKKVDEISNR